MAQAGTTREDELLGVTGFSTENNIFLVLIWQKATLCDQLTILQKNIGRNEKKLILG